MNRCRMGRALAIAMSLLVDATAARPASEDSLRDISQRDWIEVSTPNFKVLSTMKVEEAREVALELERFRAVIARFTNVIGTESVIPTHIYAFAKEGDFQAFTHSRHVAGWFSQGIRNNLMVLAKPRGKWVTTARVILHEYVHFVLHNTSTVMYPTWYSEGFAEIGRVRIRSHRFRRSHSTRPCRRGDWARWQHPQSPEGDRPAR